jgi:hypothetical protein
MTQGHRHFLETAEMISGSGSGSGKYIPPPPTKANNRDPINGQNNNNKLKTTTKINLKVQLHWVSLNPADLEKSQIEWLPPLQTPMPSSVLKTSL